MRPPAGILDFRSKCRTSWEPGGSREATRRKLGACAIVGLFRTRHKRSARDVPQGPGSCGTRDEISAERSKGTMAQIVLPAGPDEIFRLAEPVLTDIFGEGAYCLGGGTALAAVWQHRHSTDIDLFMDGSAYRAVVMDNVRRRSLEAGLLSALEPDFLDIATGVLKVLLGPGELGLYVPPSPLGWMPPVDHVSGTSVPLERPATILARKIHGRMLEVGDVTLRDLYDLAAAAELAPAELDTALQSLTEDHRLVLCDELARLPQDWVTSPHTGRPLLNATVPADLANNPALCVEAVRDMLDCGRSLTRQTPGESSDAPAKRRPTP